MRGRQRDDRRGILDLLVQGQVSPKQMNIGRLFHIINYIGGLFHIINYIEGLFHIINYIGGLFHIITTLEVYFIL